MRCMKNKKIKILICDDDKYFRMALKDLLQNHGIIIESATEAEALDKLDSEFFDLALIDMEIDGPLSGLNVLKAAKRKAIHSIILSSQNDDDVIEEAYEFGCDHFLNKVHYRNHLEPYIHSYIKNHLSNDISNFFKEKYITFDESLRSEIEKLCKINLKNKNIAITGETGVGKSLIGELLHHQTYDHTKPFVHLNCSEIPENLIESELFGHEKGSFTGALSKKIGKLEQARGGTLFLDEIATMPMNMQQKLLKAIDQKSFYPVGGNQPIETEFTLITATCEDLFEKIQNGEFRKDLFFRVSGLNLEIKPLRERSEDIPHLIKHFIKQSHRRFIIKEDAIELLKNFSWPGNIRELKKQIDILSTKERGIIHAADVTLKTNHYNQLDQWLTSNQKDFISHNGLREFIKKIEEETIKDSMKRNSGKITHSIKELKISASAFYRIYDQINLTQ